MLYHTVLVVGRKIALTVGVHFGKTYRITSLTLATFCCVTITLCMFLVCLRIASRPIKAKVPKEIVLNRSDVSPNNECFIPTWLVSGNRNGSDYLGPALFCWRVEGKLI